jgi:hypothetical protein
MSGHVDLILSRRSAPEALARRRERERSFIDNQERERERASKRERDLGSTINI